MTELCINTHDEMVPGEIALGSVINENKEWVTISLRCIEVITKEEYIKFVTERGLADKIQRSIHLPRLRFYRVEVLD